METEKLRGATSTTGLPAELRFWEIAFGSPARYQLAGSGAFSRSSVDHLITVCFKGEGGPGHRRKQKEEKQSGKGMM